MADEVYRASRGGSSGSAPDREVAQGGSIRRGRVVQDGGGYAAGIGDFTVSSECVPALCVGFVGDALAQAPCAGDVIVVRYADDFVMGFQHRWEAERCLQELRERLGKFGLELHPDKTRL